VVDLASTWPQSTSARLFVRVERKTVAIHESQVVQVRLTMLHHLHRLAVESLVEVLVFGECVFVLLSVCLLLLVVVCV
jgi:hypothetical protein